jgi:hypothetical protein
MTVGFRSIGTGSQARSSPIYRIAEKRYRADRGSEMIPRAIARPGVAIGSPAPIDVGM